MRCAVFMCAKNANGPMARDFKKFQPNRSERKKVTSVWIFSVADMDQTAAKKHLIYCPQVVISSKVVLFAILSIQGITRLLSTEAA